MSLWRRWLFVVAALIWGIPGVIITTKGLGAYGEVASGELWWHLMITAVVLLGFGLIFRRVVARYTAHIRALPQKTTILKTFPPRGWLLLGVMMCLGMAVKLLPFIPNTFIASFYSGLGPMLILSAVRFVRCF